MARQKKLLIAVLLFLAALLAACSSTDSESKMADMKGNSEEAGTGDSIAGPSENQIEQSSTETDNTEGVSGSAETGSDRMVIRQAELELRVKNFDKALQSLESKAKQFAGFIVDSTITREGEGQTNGRITIKVPASSFEDFLHEAEGEAAEVLQRNVRGEDVTEQYVDLESRLKSKRAVEERLLEFMKNAQKTEDLLKISADLGAVQEEIEQLTGKIKYFENQAAMSTITVSMAETKLLARGTNPKELDTWKRTKLQFMSSANLLLSAVSGIIVFLVGNMPLFLALAFIGIFIFFFIRRRTKKIKTNEGN